MSMNFVRSDNLFVLYIRFRSFAKKTAFYKNLTIRWLDRLSDADMGLIFHPSFRISDRAA